MSQYFSTIKHYLTALPFNLEIEKATLPGKAVGITVKVGAGNTFSVSRQSLREIAEIFAEAVKIVDEEPNEHP